ncbi:MAG: hypothetical protein AAGA71_05640 [Pseudomonadota bacterium]
MPYVSITGLRLKRFWHAPQFWRHATRSMIQAKAAPGCLRADAHTIQGVHHTRSLWESRQHMMDYLRSGAHRDAMRVFPRIGTGKVLGFEADALPDWDEVRRRWEEDGRAV